VADKSSNSIWQVLDRLRGDSTLTDRDIAGALAGLIYLRWADFYEAEQEAVAAFDETKYQSVLPTRCHWRSYCDVEAEQVHVLFATVLPETLERLGNSRHSLLATHLHRIAGAVRILGRLSPDVLHQLIRWLAVQPFEAGRDRRALLTTFDSILCDGKPRKKPPLPAGDGYGDGDYGNGDGQGGGYGDEDFGDGRGGGRGDGTGYGRGSASGAGFGDGSGLGSGQEADYSAHSPKRWRRASGEYYTPLAIAELIAALASPVAGNHVYDPCFGSASLLTAAFEYVSRNEKDRAKRSGGQLLTISGVEQNSNAYVIGVTRLALVGVANPQLELGNSLERIASDSPLSDGFDIVLANPPWGGKIDPAGLDHLPIRTSDSAALFIQHALSQLRPGGRAVLVIPPSILFGSGSLLRLRQMLLEQNTVEAVVALPGGVFMPYTSIEPRILVLRRGGTTRSIRMVEAPWLEGIRNEFGHGMTHALANLLDAVQSPSPGKHSWDVDVTSLARVEFDLTPRRRDQSGLEKILGSLPAEVQMQPLGDLCHVMSGRSIRSEYLQEVPPKSNFEPSGQNLFPEIERAGINPQQVFKFADNPVPYIRIKDVQKGVVSKGSSWLGPVAASNIEAKWKLCPGDILLSKSGTIGKAGLVRNGAIGAIAGNGFFVLRLHEGAADPHYLLAYLQSAECNAWLDDRARGSAIRHLAMNVVKELPVPVPPLPVQQRVAEQCRQHGVDALSFLAELLSEDRTEPVAAAINSWVDSNLVALDRRESASADGNLRVLEKIAESTCPLNVCVQCGQPYYIDHDSRYVNGPEEYWKGMYSTCLACWLDVGPNQEISDLRARSPLTDWTLEFREAILGLRQISQIPSGPALLNVFQAVGTKVRASLDAIKGHLPNEEKARRLAEALKSVIDIECHRLLHDVRLIFAVGSVSDIIDGMLEVVVHIQNEGPLPLRDLTLTSTPALSQERVPYLSENASHTVTLAGPVPGKLPSSFTLTVKWSALNLAGKRIDGEREVPIEFNRVSNAASSSPVDLGPSPYVCGDPVKRDRPDLFVGREELLEQIRNHIMHSGNVVLLEGNRRAGKSSILWHLEGPGAVPGWLGVYCSLQGTEGDNSQKSKGVPTAEVFRGIAVEVAKSIQKHLGAVLLPGGRPLEKGKPGIADAVRPAIKDEAPFTFFREYVEQLLDSLAQRQLRLLLLLDEFDKLQEGIDTGVTSPQVPENIRFLLQSTSRLSAVLTGTKRLKRVREEYFSALYGLGTPFDVNALPKEHAYRLVVEPIKGRLIYARDAVDRVLHLSARQPYLLQCLCAAVFRLAQDRALRTITLDQVNEAAARVVKDNGHFVDLFRYAGSERRRLILAMCQREARQPGLLRFGVIHEKLIDLGLHVREEELVSDLDWLTDLELLAFSGHPGGDTYSIAVPLMGEWIDKCDYAALLTKARVEMEDSDND
jgi:type I restriction enzyme M protein